MSACVRACVCVCEGYIPKNQISIHFGNFLHQTERKASVCVCVSVCVRL